MTRVGLEVDRPRGVTLAWANVPVVFVSVAAILTIWAAGLVLLVWTGEASVAAATPVSLLAAGSILWLAPAIGLRG